QRLSGLSADEQCLLGPPGSGERVREAGQRKPVYELCRWVGDDGEQDSQPVGRPSCLHFEKRLSYKPHGRTGAAFFRGLLEAPYRVRQLAEVQEQQRPTRARDMSPLARIRGLLAGLGE